MYPPPERLTAEVYARLPDTLRSGGRSGWAAAQGRAGIDSFLEGPAFDRHGRLHLVDIANGRILRLDGPAAWHVVAEYDGWPNGIAIHRDGRLFLADHKHGLLAIDPETGARTVVAGRFRAEGFKGLNDLTFGPAGDLFFTDQGQTGWQDPTGRVLCLSAAGTLECLMATLPSPNGLVLGPHGNELWVAVTRANAVWRLPLRDGGVSRVGTYIQMSGGIGGPDGMALDAEGGLAVAHLGTGVWRFDALGRPTHLIEAPKGLRTTNVAYGGADGRDLFITESETGCVLRARLPVGGKVLFSHA